ncbi:CD0519/CD1768 family membrane protein [Cetobacterium sp. SF1]|uniref:CD0519/CD1768 family membrane protein n=1 Tax=Cetobacterium sp. SF1 TaxID=3417654 RepID=UPI003CF4CE6A
MNKNKQLKKKAVSLEGFVCIFLIGLVFYTLAHKMGGINMINTLIKTAHDLLINTVFFIMGVAVLAGAFASILSEFGVIAMINKFLSPLMKPLYKLPGAAAIGILTTYISDNPAILSLSADKGIKKYFKNYQLPALTNLGTSFGMGFIVSAFMIAQSTLLNKSLVIPVIIGNVGAFIGSIVSVNLMIHFTKKTFKNINIEIEKDESIDLEVINYREIREGNAIERLLDAILEGGKMGVKMGMDIIPGVLIICSLVLMLTNGPGPHGYSGAAYEGVQVLPYIGEKLGFILKPLFGFTSAKAIAFPITSLGAVGAALGLVPQFIKEGSITPREIAVFTSMGMTWSGYLSTHVAMMDSLGYRKLTGKAILSHTFGGLAAGIAANLIYTIFIS